MTLTPIAVSTKEDLDWCTAIELSQLIHSRQVSPVDVVRRSLERLDAHQPTLNMFVTATPELALAAARRSESALMRKDMLPPLSGLPISIKDNIPIKGVPLTLGSRATKGRVAEFNAPVVDRLIAAGACIIGTTTMTEFGLKASSDSPLTGITRNPWDVSKSAGGSSSGSAASVAAGVTPFSVGTDGGGSLRIPAAFCGVFGFKAQFGRVPVFPMSTAPTLIHIGPIARTVSDAALLLNVLSGYDARDHTSNLGPHVDFVAACGQRIDGWRAAWSPTLGFAKPNAEVLSIVESAVSVFGRIGCHVEQVDRIADDPYDMFARECFPGAALRLRDTLSNNEDLLDPEVAEVLQWSMKLTASDCAAALAGRYQLRDRIRVLFGNYRLLLTPTLPVVAFNAESSYPPDQTDPSVLSWTSYTAIHNLTGCPAASIPCGRTRSGLPVGLQIIGRPNAEADVLAAAAAFEAIRPWANDHPGPLTQLPLTDPLRDLA